MAHENSELAGQERPKEGTFCWTEIASNNADACQSFYERVFGWKFMAGQAGEGMDYREFNMGCSEPVGGLYQIDPSWFGGNPPPPHFMTYIAVDDVDENAARAEALGAKIHKKMDVPNVGRIAMVEDPSGAMFATYQMIEGGRK
jgi:predicted enzyme related to lactoylglutathione lyase